MATSVAGSTATQAAWERARLHRAWALPGALVAYVVAMTWGWKFPYWAGVWFLPVFLGLVAVACLAWTRWRGRVEPVTAAALVTAVAVGMTDVAFFWTQPVRDIELYLKAGQRWLDGAPVYAQVPLAKPLEDLTNYPFLYPPVTLPIFGALASLPLPIAIGLWLAGSLAALVVSLRLFGLSWRWIALAIAWPPIFQGLYVGNVAIPVLLLFAAAPWRPEGLLIAPVFKLYSAISAVWLLRREHLRALIRGVALLVVLVVASLGVVAPSLWLDWVGGLRAYQVSQTLLPNYLYGFGLGRYVPELVVVAIAAVALVVALVERRRLRQLERLGVATVVASPSLFTHGWVVAIPALLRLETRWFWLAIGITSCAPGAAWFVALLIVAASWLAPSLEARPGEPWHPLGGGLPWPNAPREVPGKGGGVVRGRTTATAP